MANTCGEAALSTVPLECEAPSGFVGASGSNTDVEAAMLVH